MTNMNEYFGVLQKLQHSNNLFLINSKLIIRQKLQKNRRQINRNIQQRLHKATSNLHPLRSVTYAIKNNLLNIDPQLFLIPNREGY